MSYALNANEDWIAGKRNRIALAVFSAPPPDLAEAAISEFVGLARSNFYGEAADIVAWPARPIRDLPFTQLRDIKEAIIKPLLADEVLSLPTHGFLSAADIDAVVCEITRWTKAFGVGP